ncbi:piggyBac transposable element-derived protein 4-like [Diorhabda carinulata]|uniref:piggyBac transposable element-derived protein 4-like n=1 Tax=Diorhabda carinulata TaxID=1163345 RepID=UPI0025A0C0B9|nr:piggyBac transposable element-derived protein 4-like [Diorhabda carinulata]
MIGTLRANRRGNPKKMLNKKVKRGEAIWKREGKIDVTKWKDKRNIRIISTSHKHQMVKITTRRGHEKLKPQSVLDYNAHTSGVDRADQIMSYYSSPRKTIKWYRKIFI